MKPRILALWNSIYSKENLNVLKITFLKLSNIKNTGCFNIQVPTLEAYIFAQTCRIIFTITASESVCSSKMYYSVNTIYYVMTNVLMTSSTVKYSGIWKWMIKNDLYIDIVKLYFENGKSPILVKEVLKKEVPIWNIFQESRF